MPREVTQTMQRSGRSIDYLKPVVQELPDGHFENYPYGAVFFDPRIFRENGQIIRENVALTRTKKPQFAARLMENWHPIGAISPQDAVGRIGGLIRARNVLDALGEVESIGYYPHNVTQVWSSVLRDRVTSGGVWVPLSSDHSADYWLINAAKNEGFDISKMAWFVLDHHFDSDAPLEDGSLDKATWICPALDMGLGAVHVIGNHPAWVQQIQNGTMFAPMQDSELPHEQVTASHLVANNDSYHNYRAALSRYRGRLTMDTAYCDNKGTITSRSISRAIREALTSYHARGLTHVGISCDVDALDTWKTGVTATPYNHHDRVVRAGMRSLKPALERATMHAKGSRLVDVDAVRHAIEGLFTNNLVIEGRIFQKPLGTYSGGFSAEQLEYVVNEIYATAQELGMHVGMRLGGLRIPGIMSEIAGLDLNSNTAAVVKKIKRALEQP